MTEPTKTQAWWRGLTAKHWQVLIVAWLGWMFDVMDILMYNYVKTPACRDLLGLPAGHPDIARWAGYILAISLCGWAAGGIVFGVLGDKIGRTKTMVLTILVYSIFTGLSYFSKNVWQLAAFRFLTGLGVGGEWAAGAALLAEVFPQRSRVWAACVLQAACSGGIILAILISSWAGEHWRRVFLIGVLPALLTVWVRAGIKEPEQWQHAAGAHSRRELGSLRELFSPRFRRKTIVGVLLALSGVFGIWGANYWAPELLARVAPQNKTLILNLQTIAQFIGFVFCAPLAERIGRKFAFGFYFLGSLIATPLAFHFSHSPATAAVLVPVMGFFTGGMFSGYIVYFPELYPTRLRATGAGFCYNVARITAAPGPAIMGLLQGWFATSLKLPPLATLQWSATVIALIYLVGLAVLPFAEETRGHPLPED